MRKINDIVVPKFPVVPNSYTILDRIPSQEKWYTVLYLKDAFSSCPLDSGSRDIFAFEWEDPDTGRKQFRWMVLPKGYTESPNLFGQFLEQILEEYQKPPHVTLIQYVDYLLLTGEKNNRVEEVTVQLLNFLADLFAHGCCGWDRAGGCRAAQHIW